MSTPEAGQPTSHTCQFVGNHFRDVTQLVDLEMIHSVGVNYLV
jgi:hypothetical protein